LGHPVIILAVIILPQAIRILARNTSGPLLIGGLYSRRIRIACGRMITARMMTGMAQLISRRQRFE